MNGVQYLVSTDEVGNPQHLVISPDSIKVVHSTHGVLEEVFDPEEVEINVEKYICPENIEPDEYFLEISIPISRAEYNRLSSKPEYQIEETDDQE